MILEAVTLYIKPGCSPAFEVSFHEAQNILMEMKGYRGHELQKCIKLEDTYLLLIRWETLEDHTIGFRQSPQYERWKQLLHHFYDPFPEVMHYTLTST
ncbi:antibiotic biosynthesis monooxygenase family protein [Marinicrinis sediminis]|uniref:Antibiotic biosynthesis monooxygenase family protein n=1 Tax=Marinicrinis sediminis TaxID=1652465 RepID=A0ABW5R8X2_9BACL